jgi:hypothetical protein
MKKITFLFTFLIAFGYSAYAQVSAYSFSETTEAYAQITGTTSTATGDDGSQNTIAIGFTFNFDGTNYTDFSVNTNGFIRLGTTIGGSPWTNSLGNAAAQRPLIAPFWDDNNMTGGEIRYAVTGTSPNQVLTINWHNSKIGSTGSTASSAVSTLLRLYETTNVIEFVYSNPYTTANTVTASVGLNGASSFLSVTPAVASTVSSGTANNAINATVMANLAGKKLIFTPPTPCSGAPVAGTILPATQTLLVGQTPAALIASGYSSGVAGLTFQWEESNDDGATDAWANAVGGTGATTASYTPPVFASTIYYRLVVTCTNSALSANTSSVVLNACGSFVVPSLEDFTVYVPGCWQEADNGDLTAGPATFGTSSWIADGFGNVGTTGAFRYEVWTTGANDWILSPLYTIPVTGYELKFDAAATQWNTTNAPTTAWEADDFVEVLVSTGTTNWTVLYTFNNTNVPSNTGTPTIIDLDAYAGMDVRFAFRVVEGATNGSADIDFSVDNFEIRLTPACVEPTTLAATNITASSVDLSWVDPTGIQFDFEYAVQLAGTGVPAGTGTAVAANSEAGVTEDIDTNALTANTAYEFYVRADCGGGGFSTWAGPFNFTTSINVLCGTPVNTTHCYSDNDATTWVFTSNDGSPLRITFNAGDMESCCDNILIYDGINNTGTLLYQGNNGGDLTGLVFDSTTDSIYVEIDSDGLVSCDNSGYVSIDFDVVCATCVSPTATFAVVADCANAQYFIDVDIITIGSANSLAISDGVTTLSADLSSGTQTFGPYANGASTTITVTNEQDASCSISSSVAYSCPPDNDECNDAIVLNVNADYLCGVTTSGTNVAATDSGVEPTLSVSGTSDNDVWFSFVAVQTAHRISLADKVAVVGTSVDMGIGVFSGTCSSLALVGSSDPDVYNVSGLTIGDTYLVNVYGWYSAGSNEAQVTFNICVGTDPTLSSSSFDSNAFLAYPNPVKDILNLEYNSEIASVRVLNLLGQEVISKTIKANATQVDMTPLSAGAYIVNVTVGDTVKTIKVVKQ